MYTFKISNFGTFQTNNIKKTNAKENNWSKKFINLIKKKIFLLEIS